MDKEKQQAAPNLGKTIQRLRRAYKLSLGDLAENSGVSKSIISQIEKNESNPTLTTIWRLSNALETSIENIIKDDDLPVIIDNSPIHKQPIIKSEDGLCTLRVLSPLQTVEWIQWYEFFAEPNGTLESSPHQMGSIEHLTLLQGALELSTPNAVLTIKEGATARYRSDIEHTLTNRGTKKVHALMVLILRSVVIK